MLAPRLSVASGELPIGAAGATCGRACACGFVVLDALVLTGVQPLGGGTTVRGLLVAVADVQRGVWWPGDGS